MQNTSSNFNKAIVILILSGISLNVMLLAFFGITAHQKNYEYCKTRRTYAEVYVHSILEGKYDDGLPQKNENGEYFIDFESASHTATIEYNNQSVKCFLISDNEEYAFTLADIRGSCLADSQLRDIPFHTLFTHKEIPVCPFSTKSTIHYYCILQDGTVICSHPNCRLQ